MIDYNKKIDEQIDIFKKEITSIQEALNDRIESILNGFDVMNGQIVIDDDTFVLASYFENSINETLSEYGYTESITDTINANLELFKDRRSELEKDFGKIDVYVGDVLNTQKIFSNNFVSIKDKFIKSLSIELNNAIVQQVNINELSDKLYDIVEVQFKDYTVIYADTSKNIFIQDAEVKFAQDIFGDLDNVIWDYMGSPLVPNSHPECVWALTKKDKRPHFTNKEREDFESGLLPVGLKRSAIRYNCRHWFVISKLTVEDYYNL